MLRILKLWGHIPDMDHNREWVEIADGVDLDELRLKKEAYIERWRNTSNYFRLREKGSFKVINEHNETIEQDF